MLESFLISLLAGFTTETGIAILQHVIKKDEEFVDLKSAYEEAISKWTINLQLQNFERTNINLRVQQLVKKSLGEEIKLSSNELELIKYFENAINSRGSLNQFINKEQNIKILENLRNLEFNIEVIRENNIELSSDIKNYCNQWTDFKNETIEILNQIEKKLKINIIPPQIKLSQWQKKISLQTIKISEIELNGHLDNGISIDLLSKEYENFIEAIPWLEKINDQIISIKKSLENYHETNFQFFKTEISAIDSNYECSIVRSIILKICNEKFFNEQEKTINVFKEISNKENYDKATTILRDINKLKQIALESYNKCFNIIGSTGSGKTHFILQQLKNKIIKNDFLPIYIKTGLESDSILEELSIVLNSMLSLDANLKDIFNYLQNDTFNKYRIVFILDELESVKSLELNKLKNFIERNSNYQNIYWVFILNYGAYDRIINPIIEKFFYDYAFQNRIKNSFTSSLSQIGSWYDIDIFNLEEKISKKIIIDKTNIEFLSNYQDLVSNNKLELERQYTITPAIAWLIIDNKKITNENGNLYLDVLSLLSEMTENFVEHRISNTPIYGIYNSKSIFFEILSIISTITVSTNKTSFKSIGYLKSQMKEEIREHNSFLKNEELLQVALIMFQELNLLVNQIQIKHYTEEQSPIYLNTLIYWEYIIANKIIHNDNTELISISYNNPNLSIFFWERVYEFIFIIQSKSSFESGDIIDFVQNIFKTIDFPKSIIWFSLSRMESNIASEICQIISKSKFTFATNNHDISSMLFYFGNIHLKELAPTKKLSIINLYIYDIDKYNLIELYFNTCLKIINNIDSHGHLFKQLKLLEESHKLNKSKLLAEQFVSRLFIIDNNIEQIIDIYTKLIVNNLGSFKRNRDKYGYWIRTYFYEWVWYFICENVVKNEKFNAYNIFVNMNIYNTSNIGINKDYEKMLSTDANINLGIMYSDFNIYTKQYLKWLDSLFSGNITDKKNCLFIIRHTSSKEKEGIRIVNPVFKSLIEKIFLSFIWKDMEGYNWKKFFELNLNEDYLN